MRFRKVYLEISNICNLNCAFCPGTKRQKRAMSEDDMHILLPKLRPYTEYLYFHLMGEPLCHPWLGTFLELAHSHGFKVILTTNGTMIEKTQALLLTDAEAIVVTAEPALTAAKIKNPAVTAYAVNDLYKAATGYEGYTQAGLFVRAQTVAEH